MIDSGGEFGIAATGRRAGRIQGVIVDSSRKSTLSHANPLPGGIVLFDGRRCEHCLNCALEVAAAVDGPYVIERDRFVGCIDHRVSRP